MFTEANRLRLVRLLDIQTRRRLSVTQQWELAYLSRLAGSYSPNPYTRRRTAANRNLPPLPQVGPIFLPPFEPPRRRRIIATIPEPPPPPPIPPPSPLGPFVYRRLTEFATPTRGQRRYHIIRVDSHIQLFGAALELAFNTEIANLRRLLRYSGALWYEDPVVLGRRLVGYSTPPNPLGIYEEDFFPPDDLDDDGRYIEA